MALESPTAHAAYTPELAATLAPLYERVQNVIPEVEWAVHAPYIAAIQELKAQHNAVILAHNYQTPEIFHGVADITGDSLALAQRAAETDADIIVLCGVHFMAETAKLLNPDKTVLIPDDHAGCSLAASITAGDVRALRQRHPGVPVVTYVNTSAEVKAESDLCCTSANAVAAVESLGVDRVISCPTSIWPSMSRRRPRWRLSHGRGIARCTSVLPAMSCACTVRITTISISWRIRSARRMCCKRPILWARRPA